MLACATIALFARNICGCCEALIIAFILHLLPLYLFWPTAAKDLFQNEVKWASLSSGNKKSPATRARNWYQLSYGG
jgi:hypothetical protein